MWSKLTGWLGGMKNAMGKKVIMTLAALALDALAQRYPEAPLPDRELLLATLGMLLAGHTISDVVSMWTMKAPK